MADLRRWWWLAVALAAAGCGGSRGERAGDELVVSAASSLAAPFEELATAFEATRPGLAVRLNLDASSTLAAQVVEGAPVDVFAAADEPTMQRVVRAGVVELGPMPIARNRLAIVTLPGNPSGLDGLADLARVEGVVALCVEEAPCGRLARDVLERAGVVLSEARVTRAPNVRATLAAVRDGDAVAGIVYRSDAITAGSAVGSVPIPEDANVTASVGIAVLDDAPAAAGDFLRFVAGPEGRAALERYGFGAP